MRRSHHRAGTQLFAEDKKSGELRRPHHIDLSTGMYRGKQIIIKKTKKDKDDEGQAPINTDETTKTIEAPARPSHADKPRRWTGRRTSVLG